LVSSSSSSSLLVHERRGALKSSGFREGVQHQSSTKKSKYLGFYTESVETLNSMFLFLDTLIRHKPPPHKTVVVVCW